MAVNYTTLIADKTVSGSIKNRINYDRVDSVGILAEAEQMIYAWIRTHQMEIEAEFSIVIGDSTAPLPTRFLDPIRLENITNGYPIDKISTDKMQAIRVYSDAVLQTSSPVYWSLFNNLIQFDSKSSKAETFRIMYFQKPEALSLTNETNFLTDDFPHILRACTQMMAYDERHDDGNYARSKARYDEYVEKWNIMDDFTHRGEIHSSFGQGVGLRNGGH